MPTVSPQTLSPLRGVKPGDTVLELLAGGGYFTRILSKVVGPTGHVYATVPAALLQVRPAAADALKAIAADPAYANVTVLVQPTGSPSAPVPVDVVWTSLNYHDLHNPGPSALEIPGFNKAVLAALKPAARSSSSTMRGRWHRPDQTGHAPSYRPDDGEKRNPAGWLHLRWAKRCASPPER